MLIADLIEIALADSDQERVEIAAMEPVEVQIGAVRGLSQLIAELVDNALAFSEPDDHVRLTGFHEGGDYLISISDRGVGIPDHLIDGLNRVLADPTTATGPEPRLGIALVARLASRHGIGVRLVPGAPGTTARVTVPGRLLSSEPEAEAGGETAHRLPPRQSPAEDVFAAPDEVDDTVDLTHLESGVRTESGVVAMSEEARRETEAFLEKVFSPLMEQRGVTERPAPVPTANGNGRRPEPPRPESSERSATVTALRMRVPGENFSLTDDVPSTMAAEGAVDIRSALTRYAEGRRSASQSDDD